MPPRSRDQQKTSTPDRPPTTTPNPTVPTAPLPGFQRIDETTPNPTETETTSRPPLPGDAAAAGRAGLAEPEPGPTPEPPTSRLRRIDPATREALLEAAGMVLYTIGMALQLRFANPRRYGPNDLFLPDAQDREMIGGPVANLGARRIPEGLGAGGDAADIIALAVGTAGYAGKNVLRRMDLLSRVRTGAWSAAEQPDPPGPFADADLAGATS